MSGHSTDEVPYTPANAVQIPSSNRLYKTVYTSVTILSYYVISNAIILTTKWLFTKHFPYPLMVTTCNNGVAFLWSAFFSSFFPRDPLTKKLFLRYVLPIGLMTALEIGLSNLALKILTVSFGTILKGVGPIFTFLWGMALGLEQFSMQVGISLVLISAGIALASFGEGQEFEIVGFCFQLSASSLGGLRFAMTHKLLHQGGSDDDDIDNETPKPMSPLTATLYTSPMTTLCVLPFALALEGQAAWNKMTQRDAQPVEILDATTNSTQQTFHAFTNSTLHDTESTDASEVTIVMTTMSVIATLVFILLMSEYWLVRATSSLALSVAGVFKELLTIGGGMFFFSENIGALNVVGFSICQLGIMSYVFLRTSGASDGVEYAPLTVDEEEAPEAVGGQHDPRTRKFS